MFFTGMCVGIMLAALIFTIFTNRMKEIIQAMNPAYIEFLKKKYGEENANN
jgi:hypothetical protein